MSNEDRPDDESATPDEIDDGLAFAYGEEGGVQQDPTPSVLERIGKVTGKAPKVSLGDPGEDYPPMLKPLGPDDQKDAGKYMVQGELGRGGVGAVHKGHDQDLGRDVAMKFLHDKYKDEPSILHRFVEEAQIGGQLQHPGIVPVYDLGMSDGKPFFTMKLVKGKTLAQELADRESVADDRRRFLAMFEQICQTMAYAHVRGVVHRDLKPANIMIGSFGEVQVVDWGMGKVLERGGVADEKRAAEKQASIIETVRSSGHGTQSVIGSVMGTPAYMPPEQARGDVDAMDARSDVFALGAILCEILTGLPPYVGNSDELISMAATAKLDPAYQRLADCGATDDLIDLTKQCLMPAPAARPKSAAAVATVIQEHLGAAERRAHEANIKAAALQRTHKLSLVLMVVFVAGCIGTGIGWWHTQQANAATVAALAKEKQERERAEKNERRALAAEAAEKQRVDELVRVVEFNDQQLRSIDPQAVGAVVRESLIAATPEAERDQLQSALQRYNFTDVALDTLRKNLFDTSLEAIEAQFAIHPDIRSRLLQALARSASVLGINNFAIKSADLAADICNEHFGEGSEEALSAQLTRYKVLFEAGDWQAAKQIAQSMIAGWKALGGPDDGMVQLARATLGECLQQLGDHAAAEEQFRERLADLRQRGLEKSPGYFSALNNLASALTGQKRFVEAKSLLQEALQGEEHFGEGNLKYRAQVGLGDVHLHLGEYEDAEKVFRDVFDQVTNARGATHKDTIGAGEGLAGVLFTQGRFAEAAQTYRKIAELQTERLGSESYDTLRAKVGLAANLSGSGEISESTEILEEVIPILRRTRGRADQGTVIAVGHLATNHRKRGRVSEAEKVYREVIEDLRQHGRGDSVKAIAMRNELGACLRARGKTREVIALLEEAYASLQTHEPATPDDSIELRRLRYTIPNNLGSMFTMDQRWAEAAPILRMALANRPSPLDVVDNHRVTHNSWHAFAGSGHHAEAAQLAVDFVKTIRSTAQLKSILGTWTSFAGISLHDAQRYAEAESLLREAIELRGKTLPPDAWQMHNLRNYLGSSMAQLGRFTEAQPLLVESTEWLLANEPPKYFDKDRGAMSSARVVRMYEAWHAAEPQGGYDKLATEWQKRLEERGGNRRLP